MAETWLAQLKALEAHIATLLGPLAGSLLLKHADIGHEAATWSRLREELERIVPGPKGDLKTPPKVTDNLPKRAEPSWTAAEAALWDELRADLEALRSRIRAEIEARRSTRNPPLGERSDSPEQSSSKQR